MLAVQDASNPQGEFAPITPDRPLKAGDELIAAGRPQDVRRFTQELESWTDGAGAAQSERTGNVRARASGADFRAHLLDSLDVAIELGRYVMNHFAVAKCASLPPTAVSPSLSAASSARRFSSSEF